MNPGQLDASGAAPVSGGATPGPWQCVPNIDGGFTIEKDGAGHAGGTLVICSRNPHRRIPEESAANARLIAAAPDLYDAADMALNTLTACCISAGGVDDMRTIVEAAKKLRAAIAKALGRAS